MYEEYLDMINIDRYFFTHESYSDFEVNFSKRHFYVKYCSVLTQYQKIDLTIAITFLRKKEYNYF